MWQVMMIAREYENDIQGIAEHLVLRPDQAQAAIDYYAAYPDEINALLARNDEGYERLKRIHPKMRRYSITEEDLNSVQLDNSTV